MKLPDRKAFWDSVVETALSIKDLNAVAQNDYELSKADLIAWLDIYKESQAMLESLKQTIIDLLEK